MTTLSKFNSTFYRNAFVLLLFVVLTACASPKLRQSVDAFSKNTENAVASQQITLTNYYQSKQHEAKDFYVANRVKLGLTDECITALVGSVTKEVLSACQIKPRKPQPNLVSPFESSKVQNLAKTLGAYAKALALLASDMSEGDTALLAAFTEVGGAFVSLDSAIATATGEAPRLSEEKKGALVTLIAQATSAWLQYKRDRALMDIITASKDDIEKATKILSESMIIIQQSQAGVALRALEAAVAKHENVLAAGGDEKDLRAANQVMDERLAAYKSALAISDPYQKIGEAHMQLNKLIESGFDNENYKVFIRTLIEIAQSAKAFTDTV